MPAKPSPIAVAAASARRAVFSLALVSLGMAAACRSSPPPPITTPEAAIAVAKAAWPTIYDKTHYPVYSQEETRKFEPYTATLKDGVWIVKGTIPPGYRGPTLVTKVRVSDGFGPVDVVEIK